MFGRGLVDGGDARLPHAHLALQELGQLVTASTRSVRDVGADVDGDRDGEAHVAFTPFDVAPPARREESVADRADPQRPVGRHVDPEHCSSVTVGHAARR